MLKNYYNIYSSVKIKTGVSRKSSQYTYIHIIYAKMKKEYAYEHACMKEREQERSQTQSFSK